MKQSTRTKLISFTFVVPFVLLFALSSVKIYAEVPKKSGIIKGQLTDSKSQAIRTGHVVVFLCDATSGMPLSPKTRKVMGLGFPAIISFDQYWHAITNDSGGFQFENVPVGTYRLIAQAWSGISGMPRALPGSSRTDPGKEPSSLIVLHGVAESIVVKANETTVAYPRQWGEEKLRIETDPKAAHNFLLISRKPRLGDGVLGPMGWGKGFISGVIGITRMEDTHVTLIGLPKDATIHTGLFNYDNNPGLGGESFVVGSSKPAILSVYATWSDGKYDPPPRLAKLTLHLEETGLKVEELTKLGPIHPVRAYLDRIWNTGHNTVEVKRYGEARIIDLLAANSYRRLRKFHHQREQRPTKKQQTRPDE